MVVLSGVFKGHGGIAPGNTFLRGSKFDLRYFLLYYVCLLI